MKTYTKQITVTRPMLEIQYDDNAESPRTWSNLGYFITQDRRYTSPDDHPDFMEVIKETGEYATSTENHMTLIKKEIESRFTGEKVLAIYPVCKYEHSGVVYSLGTKHGFDYSNNGFYIVTAKTAKELGTPKKSFEKVIADELNTYTQWANGEVYGFALYDEKGELVNSCWGFYDIEDIKNALPTEWKDENLLEYIK